MQLKKAINFYIKDIEKLHAKLTPNSEFEVMFYNYNKDFRNRLSLENYTRVISYLTNRGKIKINTMLDISYDNIRISINGIENINKYVTLFSKKSNFMFFKNMITVDDKNVTIQKKNKIKEDKIDIDDFYLRFRLSEEKDMLKSELDQIKKQETPIIFRFKERISYYIENEKDTKIVIDVTKVKQVKNINDINFAAPIYELELELMSKNKKKEHLDIILDEAEKLIKVLQESNYIISVSESENVVSYYRNILNINKEKQALDGRQPVSLEIRHLINVLPNKYAVTDKADGDRYFLIIKEKHVYLISTNLEVKYTGIELQNNNYDGTVLDGEYIYLDEENRHIYMFFDCLRVKDVDLRNEIEFSKRIQAGLEICNECFIFKGQKQQKIGKYKSSDYDNDKLIEYHRNEMINNMSNLNHDIKIRKDLLLIRSKYFISVIGLQDNEIYKYSVLMWNLYMYDKSIKCPYTLDGLIYQPLQEPYVTNKADVKLFEYKWKPPTHNTIDFYIEFERDRNNRVIYVFDNSKEDMIENRPYVICNLYSGKKTKTDEIPIKFNEDENEHETYLFVDNNHNVLDIEGNAIQDKTVVEFYYNNDINTDKKIKWVPIRTRYDKTESVIRYQKKYGNEISTAKRIWDSIQYPVLFNDIDILSKDKMFKKHCKILFAMENKKTKQPQVYYQKVTNLAKPMRAFHNWVKDEIIKRHAQNADVLDYACGRGGDILKYFYSGIKSYIGVDIDYNGIHSPGDGAIARYKNLSRKFNNFPLMTFIQADGGAIFEYDKQKNIIAKMSEKNKEHLDKYLSGNIKYDLISCQFAIHYFLENKLRFSNFCDNLCNLIKNKGYFICTTFDADEVIKLLDNNDTYTISYITKDGEKKTFFEIIKKFDIKSDTIGTGKVIDVHNSWISDDNVYQTEYLVSKDYLVNKLKEKCGLKLIESKLFSDIYKDSKETLMNSTDSYMKPIQDYYDQKDEINKKSMIVTNLNRYYIFRKDNSDNVSHKKEELEELSTELDHKDRKSTKNKSDKTSKVSKKEKPNKHK